MWDVSGKSFVFKLLFKQCFYSLKLIKAKYEIFCNINQLTALNLILDSPPGAPTIMPEIIETQETRIVNFTCVNPINDGNPACNRFRWEKVGDDKITFPTGKHLVFTADRITEGNFTCWCQNPFGESEISSPASLILVRSKLFSLFR